MDNNLVTIEKFREIITEQYLKKGVKPPIPGGEKEKELYNSWLAGKEKLKGLVDQTREEIEPILTAGTNPDAEYFVHNDAAPDNIFFRDNGEDVLLDFEHAAATNNLPLAQLTDLANCYGKLWPNPEMQRDFLKTYLEDSTAEALDYNYKLLRTTVVFGVMCFSKYVTFPLMLRSLLGNLEDNLSLLDTQYQTQKVAVIQA